MRPPDCPHVLRRVPACKMQRQTMKSSPATKKKLWQGGRRKEGGKTGVGGEIAPLISSYFLPATTRVTMATPQKAVCGELWI